MIIVLHVIIALASIAFATYLAVVPTATKFKINNALIGGTFVSGTILVLQQNALMLHACSSGLLYLATVILVTVMARQRYSAKQN
jgi:hypothetical protein